MKTAMELIDEAKQSFETMMFASFLHGRDTDEGFKIWFDRNSKLKQFEFLISQIVKQSTHDENKILLEEKAKLIERVDNAEKRVNFWLTHWNKLDMEFTEFKSSITSPQ